MSDRAILTFLFVASLLSPTASAQTLTLDEAVKAGKVEVTIMGMGGSTGDTIQMAVQRKVPETLRLALTPGTVFKSANGNVQNMIAASITGERVGEKSHRPTSTIVLTDNAKHTFIIAAYCMDFHKGNPGPSDSFTLASPDDRGMKIVQAGEKASASIQAIQAALWMDRENISATELRGRFPVDDKDIAVARGLLQELGKAEKVQKQPTEKPSSKKEAPIKVGDTVVVSEDGAKLTLGSKVLAELSKGSKIKVVQLKDDWIGGHVTIDGKKQAGWIAASSVAQLVTEDRNRRPKPDLPFTLSRKVQEPVKGEILFGTSLAMVGGCELRANPKGTTVTPEQLLKLAFTWELVEETGEGKAWQFTTSWIDEPDDTGEIPFGARGFRLKGRVTVWLFVINAQDKEKGNPAPLSNRIPVEIIFPD